MTETAIPPPTPDQVRHCTKLLKTTRSPQKLLDGGKLCATDARYLESPNVLAALLALLNPKQVCVYQSQASQLPLEPCQWIVY
jgi:hypothetical protein